MGDVYYRWFPGDYMRDTSDLSMTEDSAYRRLLDHYYSEGHLPAARDRLFRICRASSTEEQRAVDFVAGRFFTTDGDRLWNKRAEKELTERRKFIAEQKRKSVLGHRARWGKEAPAEMSPGISAGNSRTCPDDALPSPSPSPSPPASSENTLSGSPANSSYNPDCLDNQIPYAEIIGYLNKKAGKQFTPKSAAARRHIRARWGEGARLEDFQAVVDNQVQAWKGTEMEMYLRPITLFNSEKFDGYRNAGGGYGRGNRSDRGAAIKTGQGNALRNKYAGIGTAVVVGGEDPQG